MAAEMFPQTGAVTFRDAKGLQYKHLWQAAKELLRGFTLLSQICSFLSEFPALQMMWVQLLMKGCCNVRYIHYVHWFFSKEVTIMRQCTHP